MHAFLIILHYLAKGHLPDTIIKDIEKGVDMKIERSETFVLNEIVWRENILVPENDRDEVSTEFIRCYQTGNFENIEPEPVCQEISIAIALCILGEKETWRNVSSELKKDGWSGASLLFWKLYVQDKKAALPDSVMLPGVRYRDDDIIEWFPVVHHCPIVSLFGVLRGSETRVSMKSSMTLGLAKSRTVLISKTHITKT